MRTYAGVTAFMLSFAIPMSFFYYVFPPMLRSFGHGPEIVGAFAMVYLPYVLRGAWAFAIERMMKGEASRYRIATFVLALLGAASVLLLLLIDPTQQIGAAMGIAVAIFVIFSSGMTTLDGYLLASLTPEERAQTASYSAIGYALGGIVVGFLAWFDAFAGQGHGGVLLLALATLVPAVFILMLPKGEAMRIAAHKDAAMTARTGLAAFVTDHAIRALVVMALLAQGTSGLLSGYLPILQVDAGLSIGEIGLFSAIGSNVMGLIGAVFGGWLLTRFGGWRTLAAMTGVLAVCLVGVAALHDVLWGKGFAIGLTALLMMAGYIYYVPYRALILETCDGPGSVSRVAVLSSFSMAIGIVGMTLAGVVAVRLGLTLFFTLGAVLMLVATIFALGHRQGARLRSEPNLTFKETSRQ